MEQLGHHDVGDAVVDLGAHEDDPLLQQPAVDVEAALAGGRPLDDVGNRVAAHRRPTFRSTPTGLTSVSVLTTRSTMPYAAASSALSQRSRSLSRVICSTLWPVCSACSSLTRRLTAWRLAAWTSTSAAVPWIPADGWCIMIRALGRRNACRECPRRGGTDPWRR